MDNKTIHKLLQPKYTETLCGIEVNAIYPVSSSAMVSEAGKDPIRITFFKGVSCKECKERSKDNS